VPKHPGAVGEQRGRRFPTARETLVQQLIGGGLVVPHGDRRELAQSGGVEDEMAAAALHHHVVRELVLHDHVGDDFAAAALSPPEGRLNVMVLRALGARFGIAPATIAETLFPLRRPSPYQL